MAAAMRGGRKSSRLDGVVGDESLDDDLSLREETALGVIRSCVCLFENTPVQRLKTENISGASTSVHKVVRSSPKEKQTSKQLVRELD